MHDSNRWSCLKQWKTQIHPELLNFFLDISLSNPSLLSLPSRPFWKANPLVSREVYYCHIWGHSPKFGSCAMPTMGSDSIRHGKLSYPLSKENVCRLWIIFVKFFSAQGSPLRSQTCPMFGPTHIAGPTSSAYIHMINGRMIA